MNRIRPFVLALLLLSVITAVGCNTFKGLGRDVEKGGEKIQESAEEAKPSNN